jgi:TNF receptor-associated factor 2/TNF receptor-associated factor 3
MTRHSLLECGVARTCVGCNQKIDVNPTGRNPTIATHLKEPGVVFEHLQALGNEVKSCGLKVASNSSQLRQLANVKDSDNRSKEKSLDDILIRLANVEAATTENKQAIATRGAGVSNQGGLYGSGISSYGSNQYDSDASDRLAQLENKLAEQERTAGMLKVHISELELQLQASLASTYNGSFLWRIPDVKRRRRDAIDGKITSIYSPPFYTGRNGYKMCIRAYLNGDGIGYNTHVSIFFVLMKGEYDPLLKWPFDYKVSLILVDQDHRRHIVQTFKPSPSSSSFQRPKSDMNIASGCPKFSELKVLDNESYVKEDVMYIKAIVDTTRIFHP